jgi:hypothetical protein
MSEFVAIFTYVLLIYLFIDLNILLLFCRCILANIRRKPGEAEVVKAYVSS